MQIEAREEIWPLKQLFRISRGSRTEARVVVVTVTDGQHTGRGEGVPIARYNQSVASVLEQIESIKREKSLDRHRIQQLLPAGAARNALDCALWDLEAKISGKRAWELANVPMVPKVETSFTISLDSPDKMGAAAKASANAPILKLKLGGDNLDLARLTSRYEVINVKLDKTGGPTEALHLCEQARKAGFKLLIGCMIGTSLGMAPARLLASIADYVDLDGPLLLARDREHGLSYQNSGIGIPSRELWG